VSAQTFALTQSGVTAGVTCNAAAQTVPNVYMEGHTELIGGLNLTCTGITSTVTLDVVLSLNTSITNPVAVNRTSSATLQVNGGNSQPANVLGYSTIHWPGVTLSPGNATITIGNVLADASLLHIGSNSPSLAVTAQVNLNSTATVSIPNSTITLAIAQTTLTVLAGAPNPLTGGPQTILALSYQEMTPNSFGTATRFRMVLTNVPSTVQVYAPVYSAGGGAAQAQLYTPSDCAGSAGPLVTSGVTLAGSTYSLLTQASPGVYAATWLVQSANPSSIDTLAFPVLLTNATAANLQSLQISGSYAGR
jgi:hypothetical protein